MQQTRAEHSQQVRNGKWIPDKEQPHMDEDIQTRSFRGIDLLFSASYALSKLIAQVEEWKGEAEQRIQQENPKSPIIPTRTTKNAARDRITPTNTTTTRRNSGYRPAGHFQ